jgi:indole-3-glycerol phosphate synthase
MSEFLAQMAAESRRRVRDARSRTTEGELLRRSGGRPEPKRLELRGDGFDLIAEIKFRSPSAERLTTGSKDAVGRAAAYERGGAAAVSVVTEPSAFGGSLESLSDAAGGCSLPVMRKDFLVDPFQLVEAKAYGASGVLLIVRILDTPLLREMIAAAVSLELFALIEAFDRDELERGAAALAAFPANGLLGVNARDLATLAVDRRRHAELAGALPGRVPVVAESGIRAPEDASAVARLGYRAALVGEAFMAETDPQPLVQRLLAAGRGLVR